MKSTEKFMRGVRDAAKGPAEAITGAFDHSKENVLCPLVSRADAYALYAAVRVLGDAITILADHAKQAKARADRIQWIGTTLGPYVARIGRHTAEYSPAMRRVVVYGADLNVVARFEATSIESAARAIRRWRKKQ